MKKIAILFFIFFNISSTDNFELANSLFKEKKYEQAINFYNQIEDKSFSVWFNLGNAYYKLGNYFDALIAFNKSKKLASFKELFDVEQNLNIVSEKLNLKFKKNIFYKFTKLFSYLLLQLILILLLVLIFVFYKKFKKLAYCFLILFLAFFSIYVLKFNLDNRKVCFIKNEISLKVGPGEDFHSIFSLPLGQQVEFLKQENYWFLVKFDNKVGWLNKNDCIEI